MAHWTEKRKARALLHDAVAANGWTMFGHKKDDSDSMTDYYSPADWDGIATKNGSVLCVDVSPYKVKDNSGKVEEESYREATGECPECKGTGDDPSGWTYEKAKADPQGFAVANLIASHIGEGKVKDVRFGTMGKDSVTVVFEGGNSVTDPFGMSVVSPLQFGENGKLRCGKCGGKGKMFETKRRPNGVVWPTFQANPAHCSWHIEKDGKVIAKGTGVYSVGGCGHEDGKQKAKKLADKWDKIAGSGNGPKPPSKPRPIQEEKETGMERTDVEKAAQAKLAPTIAKIGTEPVYVLSKLGIMVRGTLHMVETAPILEAAGLVPADKANEWVKPTELVPNCDKTVTKMGPESGTQVDDEPAPVEVTPEPRDALQARLVEAFAKQERAQRLKVVPSYKLQGDDGNWYTAFGFPRGVKSTGERRLERWAFQATDGTTHAQEVYKTKEEAEAFQEAHTRKAVAEFAEHMATMTDAELVNHAAYWLKEDVTVADEPKPEPEPLDPVTSEPALDSLDAIAQEIKRIERLGVPREQLAELENQYEEARNRKMADEEDKKATTDDDEQLPSEPDIEAIAKDYAEAVKTYDTLVLQDVLDIRCGTASNAQGKAKARCKRLVKAGLLDKNLEITDEMKKLASTLLLAKEMPVTDDVPLELADAKPVKMPDRYDPKGIDDIDHTARSVAEMFHGYPKHRYALNTTHVMKNCIEATTGCIFIRIPGAPNDPTDRLVKQGEMEAVEGRFPDGEMVFVPIDKEDLVATIDVPTEAQKANGMRPSVILGENYTAVKLVRPGRKHDMLVDIDIYQRALKAAVKLGLKQLDVYTHAPSQPIMLLEHGAAEPVKIVFMPLAEASHCYTVDFNAAQPQPEPKEEPMPVVNFKEAKAKLTAKPQPSQGPAKVTNIAEARRQQESCELTPEELERIKAIAASMMAQ